MFNAWLAAAGLAAVVHWFATANHWRRLGLVTKGGTLALLIAWFSSVSGWHDAAAWFGIGLVCGLAGDILLELSPRFFLFGLIAFLLGHLSYISGLLSVGVAPGVLGWGLGIGLLAAAGLDVTWLLRGMNQTPASRAMRAPVLVYGIVLSAMAFLACLTLGNPAWPGGAALCLAGGGSLFLLSDSLLARRQFVRPFRLSNLAVMVSYHLAQFLIAAGVLLGLA